MSTNNVRALGAGFLLVWGASLILFFVLGDAAPSWLAGASFACLALFVALVGGANLFERWKGRPND